MKIVNLIGGLGNQMFVYATFIALKNIHKGEPIKLCTRSFVGYPLHNGYEIGRIFNVNEEAPSTWELIRLAYPFFNYKGWQIMTHLLPRRKSMLLGTEHIPFNYDELLKEGNYFYNGYWQNEKNFINFRKEVLEAYNFPEMTDERNIELAKKLKTCSSSVSCHIRRGDYLKDPRWNVCTPDYYQQAISMMVRKVSPDLFCVFSDDINWCKKNMANYFGDIEVIYVDYNKGDQSFRDMQIMSLCNHNIVANSSFSWWGAWLNQGEGQVVISPSQWMKTSWVNNPVPDSWIKIEVAK